MIESYPRSSSYGFPALGSSDGDGNRLGPSASNWPFLSYALFYPVTRSAVCHRNVSHDVVSFDRQTLLFSGMGEERASATVYISDTKSNLDVALPSLTSLLKGGKLES